MSVPRLTLRSVEIRSVSIPLERPVVSKVGLFDRWPLVVIDLQTEEGIVDRRYLEPYLERAVRYLVLAIRDLAEVRKGRPAVPLDDFRTGAGLNLIGLGLSPSRSKGTAPHPH
jgi:mandelate racemase